MNVKLNLTEDTQSDTYKNIIGIYEELKDQNSKIDEIDIKLNE